MKRMLAKICPVAVIGLTLIGSAQAQTPQRAQSKAQVRPNQLPVFSFLGDTTKQPTQRTDLAGNKCEEDGDKLHCATIDQRIADVPLSYLSMDYYRGLLHSVFAKLSSSDFIELTQALTVKYGDPKMSVEKWQSRSGAQIDNTVLVWNFEDGQLRFKAHGESLSSSSLIFQSAKNAPPAKAPVVDF